jgi:hypothetical protein
LWQDSWKYWSAVEYAACVFGFFVSLTSDRYSVIAADSSRRPLFGNDGHAVIARVQLCLFLQPACGRVLGILSDREANTFVALVPIEVIVAFGMSLLTSVHDDPVGLDATVVGQNYRAEAGAAIRKTDGFCQVTFAFAIRVISRESITSGQVTEAQGYGGEGGIRTPDTLSGMPVFKTGALNRSATSPEGTNVRTGLIARPVPSWARTLRPNRVEVLQ